MLSQSKRRLDSQPLMSSLKGSAAKMMKMMKERDWTRTRRQGGLGCWCYRGLQYPPLKLGLAVRAVAALEGQQGWWAGTGKAEGEQHNHCGPEKRAVCCLPFQSWP